MRSAITVAGMSGVSREQRSNCGLDRAHEIEPEGLRVYRGGSTARRAARTVFRDTPIGRAIAFTPSHRNGSEPDFGTVFHLQHLRNHLGRG